MRSKFGGVSRPKAVNFSQHLDTKQTWKQNESMHYTIHIILTIPTILALLSLLDIFRRKFRTNFFFAK